MNQQCSPTSREILPSNQCFEKNRADAKIVGREKGAAERPAKKSLLSRKDSCGVPKSYTITVSGSKPISEQSNYPEL